jgi:hypothetical protein
MDREDIIKTLEAIVWITDARRAIRPQRARAMAGQIARTAVEDLRRPRLVETSQSDARGGTEHG